VTKPSSQGWRRMHPGGAVLLVGLLWPLLSLGSSSAVDTAWLPPDEPARTYAERALRTQRYTMEHLANPPALDRCGWVRFIGYERNDGSVLSDAWYNAAQLQADAAMVHLGQDDRSCILEKTAAFFDILAVAAPPGGFWPRANVDGRNPTRREIFADDNALIGLALLEARAASDDEVRRAKLLDQAEHAAGFLIDGEMWDETFGGGFWWNSARGRIGEGKPSQTTALAAQLFARLYLETGQPHYAEWARRSLAWLETRLRDPHTGLYYYTVRHWDVAGQTGEYLDPRFFGYDQGVMIELHLLFERAIEPDAGHLERARELAATLEGTFWDHELGGYRVTNERPDVSAAYSAWLTQSLLALHAADPDPHWLAWAMANLEALEPRLTADAQPGYANLYYRCEDRKRSGCESGQPWTYDPTRYLVSQSWMQRAQALLAARLAGRG
jgi:glycosyl hydrolase family 76